ncbi:hypothetical protein CAPTEDRAFT_229249 [Capitella teleta]|uniref:Methyltransferase domain-containing protein n=1 Tax=Capitella teleta TaxID=283909 RepID=R7TJZ8_CAPTE|nr:hypothetical protein CAPTEDRAFT_229249 [Capitella teleta]|eukprot:ELT91435.1 hypothetical protein CAPTEDRAFT_229249 [Capitella teleta]
MLINFTRIPDSLTGAMRRGTGISVLFALGVALIIVKVLIQTNKQPSWLRFSAYNDMSWEEITQNICSPRQIMCEKKRDDLFDALHKIDAQELVHSALTKPKYKCRRSNVYGKINNGGYDLCEDDSFALKKGDCIVYSLGIANSGIQFEEGISKEYDCEMHVFQAKWNVSLITIDDEAPGKWNHHDYSLWGDNFEGPDGVVMRRFGTILKEMQHENRIIDILKIDAQGGEWPFLRDLSLNHKLLKNVKQVILTANGPRRKPKEQEMRMTDYAQVFRGISILKRVGFLIWNSHSVDMPQNCCKWWADLTPTKVSEGAEMICCYQVFMVNADFMNLAAQREVIPDENKDSDIAV